MPGPFNVDSMSFVGPTTMEGWANVPVQQKVAVPTFLGVDMAAAALGEQLYGAGNAFRDFYYFLYFGVGLGGCMVQGGDLLRGSWGNAGEVGHMPVVPGGDPCPCGHQGCLERYVSLDAYERRRKSIGDDAWVAEIAPILRAAVVTIENLFDPETIIVGGVARRDLLVRMVASTATLPNSVTARRNRRTPRVVLSERGQDAVLRGAAALAVSGILSPRFGQTFTPGEELDPIMREPAKAQAA